MVARLLFPSTRTARHSASATDETAIRSTTCCSELRHINICIKSSDGAIREATSMRYMLDCLESGRAEQGQAGHEQVVITR